MTKNKLQHSLCYWELILIFYLLRNHRFDMFLFIYQYYSYLKALIGFNNDALYAGKKPNNKPTNPETPKGNKT